MEYNGAERGAVRPLSGERALRMGARELRVETPAGALVLLDPPLVEREEQLVTRLQRPADTALPAHVPRPVVVLKQIRQREPRRRGVVHIRREDAGDEVAFREPRERLVGADAHHEARRNFVRDARRHLLRFAGPVTAVGQVDAP